MIDAQFRRLASSFKYLAILFICVVSVSALALQPTPQQISQFKSMSPAQQSQLAQQFGVSLPAQSQQNVSKEVVAANTVEARELDSASKETQAAESSKNDEDAEEINKIEKKQTVGLKRFGYDLFAGKPTTFTPITDIPVSSDYILGPGDSLKVNLYGKESMSYELAIDQEGMVYLPELGPLSLAGLDFSEAKDQLILTIDQKMIGVKASVSMGQLRSIRVFVLGEAHQPGSYVVSSLSTITNALVLSGGVTTNGSLRSIQLKRRGELVQTLDLYDLLLKGDTTNDAQLKSGDVVFIPPVGMRAGIHGEVIRPAIYEIKPGQTAEQLISLAGGLLSTAHPKLTKVQRIGRDDEKLLLDIDLASSKSPFVLSNGDDIYIPPSLGILNNVVSVAGAVLRPGMQNWYKGMRVSDVIDAAGLSPNTDLQYALIKRYLDNGRMTVLSFQMSEVLANTGSSSNIPLKMLDEVVLFSRSGNGRQAQLSDIVAQLRAQTEPGELVNSIKVEGAARFPGVYPITSGMRLSDLLALAGVEAKTDPNYALLIRQQERRKWDVVSFKPLNILEMNDLQGNVKLQPLDNIILFSQLDNDRQSQVEEVVASLRGQADLHAPSKEVTISGSVRFPGTYPLTSNMSVDDLIHAAGGLTEKAFQLRAELNRSGFDEQQRRTQSRVDFDLTQTDSLLFTLESRDVLQVKVIPNWAESKQVTLAGEVKFPGVYPIYKDDTLADLLERAGGLTEYAYAPGAIFTREELKVQQAQQLQEMQQRLAEDIAKAELIATNQSGDKKETGDIGEAQKLLSQLKQTRAAGRLVIDLQKVLDKESSYSIPLQDGDKLAVPTKKNSVTIIGEVQLPISQVYEQELDYWEYINRSGGTTDKADEDRVYIIKANGGVQIPQSSNWFASGDTQIAPGDTIVVPLDADKLDQIVLWRDVSQIFYQIALGVVAVGSL